SARTDAPASRYCFTTLAPPALCGYRTKLRARLRHFVYARSAPDRMECAFSALYSGLFNYIRMLAICNRNHSAMLAEPEFLTVSDV
ncbi:MAG TPA: hypothetical protein VHX12_01035, partial [Acidisoma sp.]|nr:hypothetical protein [Acidisoma sp.]